MWSSAGSTPFRQVADSIRAAVVSALRGPQLGDRRRVAFYPVGAATALVLDRPAPGWQRRYLTEMFWLERYFVDPR